MSSIDNLFDIDLPQMPRLAPWVHVLPLGDDRIQFRGAEFSYTLDHPLMVEIFDQVKPRLDGQNGLNEVLESNTEKYLPTTVSFLLKVLKLNGILQEGFSISSRDTASSEFKKEEGRIQFFSHFVQNPRELVESLQKIQIAVVGAHALTQIVVENLEKSGFQKPVSIEISEKNGSQSEQDNLKERFKGNDLIIACQENEGYPFFDLINTVGLESGIRWMHVSLYGTRAILGPTIIPFQTACFTCYETRRISHSDDWQGHAIYRSSFHEKSHPGEGSLFSLWTGLASQVSLEALRILTGFAPPKTFGRFYEFSAVSPVPEGHDVLRLPRCPNCNPPDPKREIWDSLASL